jgi:hypothetical protein
MILSIIRLNFKALSSTGCDTSLYSITTLFSAGIPHNLCKPVMVSTSKQVLPSGLIPNTLIITDVNYFELNINYKIYIRIYWHFYKYIYLLSRAGRGVALCGAGSSGYKSCESPIPSCKSFRACVSLLSVPALLWGNNRSA